MITRYRTEADHLAKFIREYGRDLPDRLRENLAQSVKDLRTEADSAERSRRAEGGPCAP